MDLFFLHYPNNQKGPGSGRESGRIAGGDIIARRYDNELCCGL